MLHPQTKMMLSRIRMQRKNKMTKKHLKIILIMVFAVALTFILSGCGSDGYSIEGKNVVTFELDGGIITTKNSSFDIINFAYDPGTYILDPIKDLGYTVNRPDYEFTGWYTSPECKPGDEWNFGTLFEQEKLTLYAGWKKSVKYTYTVYYVENNVATALGSYAVNAGDAYKDLRGYENKRNGYTSIGIYSDKTLETPWDSGYKHPGGETDTDIPVYVDYIKGEWSIVDSFDKLKSAMKSGKNVYLTADIDCNGNILSELSLTSSYGGIFEGNGHTVSNFKIIRYAGLKTAIIAVFAKLDANAEVRNVNFTDVIYDFTGIKADTVKVAALAVSSEENVKINNVSVTGTITTDYTGSITTQNKAVLEADETTVESGFTATVTINVQN